MQNRKKHNGRLGVQLWRVPPSRLRREFASVFRGANFDRLGSRSVGRERATRQRPGRLLCCTCCTRTLSSVFCLRTRAREAKGFRRGSRPLRSGRRLALRALRSDPIALHPSASSVLAASGPARCRLSPGGKARRLIPSARNQPENRLSFWGRAKTHLPRISRKDETHGISTRRVENAARPFLKLGTNPTHEDAEQRKFILPFFRGPKGSNVTAVRTKRSTSFDCLQRVSNTNDVAQTPSSVNPSHFQGSLFESRWLKTQRQRRTRPKSCTTSRRNHLAILAATLEATFARTFALVGRLSGESELGPPASRWWWWREWWPGWWREWWREW